MPDKCIHRSAWLHHTWHHTADQHHPALVSPICDPPRLVYSTFLARRLHDYGKRSFAVNGQVVWNSLPAELRSPDISLDVLKARLKTFLFSCQLSAFGVFSLILRSTNILNNDNNNNLACKGTCRKCLYCANLPTK